MKFSMCPQRSTLAAWPVIANQNRARTNVAGTTGPLTRTQKEGATDHLDQLWQLYTEQMHQTQKHTALVVPGT